MSICDICKEEIVDDEHGGKYLLSNKLYSLHFGCYRDMQDLIEKLRVEELKHPNPDLLLD